MPPGTRTHRQKASDTNRFNGSIDTLRHVCPFCPHSAKKANHPSSPTTRPDRHRRDRRKHQCHGGRLVPRPSCLCTVLALAPDCTIGEAAVWRRCVDGRHVATVHASATKSHREPSIASRQFQPFPSARQRLTRSGEKEIGLPPRIAWRAVDTQPSGNITERPSWVFGSVSTSLGKARDAPIYAACTVADRRPRHGAPRVRPPHAAQAQGQHDGSRHPHCIATRDNSSADRWTCFRTCARQLDAVAWLIVDAAINLCPLHETAQEVFSARMVTDALRLPSQIGDPPLPRPL